MIFTYLSIPPLDKLALFADLGGNRHRRHLTPEQQKQILEDLHRDKEQTKRLALALRRSGMTLEQTAAELGMSYRTVDEWEKSISDFKNEKANIPPPDWRVKLAAEIREELVDRYHSSASQKQREDQQQDHDEDEEQEENDNSHGCFVSSPSTKAAPYQYSARNSFFPGKRPALLGEKYLTTTLKEEYRRNKSSAVSGENSPRWVPTGRGDRRGSPLPRWDVKMLSP